MHKYIYIQHIHKLQFHQGQQKYSEKNMWEVLEQTEKSSEFCYFLQNQNLIGRKTQYIFKVNKECYCLHQISHRYLDTFVSKQSMRCMHYAI